MRFVSSSRIQLWDVCCGPTVRNPTETPQKDRIQIRPTVVHNCVPGKCGVNHTLGPTTLSDDAIGKPVLEASGRVQRPSPVDAARGARNGSPAPSDAPDRATAGPEKPSARLQSVCSAADSYEESGDQRTVYPTESAPSRPYTMTPAARRQRQVAAVKSTTYSNSVEEARSLTALDEEGAMPVVPTNRAAWARLFGTDVKAVEMAEKRLAVALAKQEGLPFRSLTDFGPLARQRLALLNLLKRATTAGIAYAHHLYEQAEPRFFDHVRLLTRDERRMRDLEQRVICDLADAGATEARR